jgi:hypothetical protein
MDRWTGQKFQLKNHKTLTVTTAYRPCKHNNIIQKSTSSNTYRQQLIMLTEEGYTNPEPRKIFIEDMITIMHELMKESNNHTILMIDANENVNDSEGGIAKLLQETKLIDTFSCIGMDECNIPTYVRGSKKIDYIFTSESLVPYIHNIGCLPFYMYNKSDRRGLFLDISEDLIDDKIELKKPAIRQIGTNCSGNEIYLYKKYIDKHFHIHKIYEKTNNLPSVSNHTTKRELEKILNNLDQTITEILLVAEKKCCRVRHNSNWSIDLHLISILCKYWLKSFKGYKNNINVANQLKRLHEQLPETIKSDIDKLLDNTSITNMLRLSKQQLRKHINIKKQLLINHKTLRQQSLEELKKTKIITGSTDTSRYYRKNSY